MKMMLIVLALFCALPGNESLRYDFGKEKDGQDWRAINDGVMGGRSMGELSIHSNTLKFEGEISLQNNGGFASAKSPFGSTNLSGVDSVRLRYRHLGEPVFLTLEDSQRFFDPYFKFRLPDSKGEWVESTHDIQEFVQYQLGRRGAQKISDDFLARVIRIGLIVGDKKEGPFEIELDYLHFE